MAKQPAIEEHFKTIEDTVTALADGTLPLEQSLQRYEAGLKAVRLAKTMLDQYVARLEELRADDAQAQAAPSEPKA